MALQMVSLSAPKSQPSSSSVRKPVLKPAAHDNESGRRTLLSFLFATATIATPEASDSKKALLQKYLKKSQDNKEKNDKERLDGFNKRNYKDYFGFIEESIRGKKEEELSESEKAILEWLKNNQ
ncbi:hypothetical protein QJS04_geneDACA016026 [Acorus gramineus]|uniref:Uncharacterized protein n=1 Tax=Acorus gramineus TaxID=55184 RepID=A0AAV9BFM6_ACOGR|nr:hypothetical protein QJS04_geneDACA016026 [Acorus gramineus]